MLNGGGSVIFGMLVGFLDGVGALASGRRHKKMFLVPNRRGAPHFLFILIPPRNAVPNGPSTLLTDTSAFGNNPKDLLHTMIEPINLPLVVL